MIYYLYIDRVTLDMVKCSPVYRENPKYAILEMDVESGAKIAQGDIQEMNRYFVVLEDDVYTLHRKEEVAQVAASTLRRQTLQEITPKEDADCIITLDLVNQKASINLIRIFGIRASAFLPSDIKDSGEKFTLYITKKNDPSYLLYYFDVTIKELLSVGGGVEFSLPALGTNVSLYTKQVASTYSLEIVNGTN